MENERCYVTYREMVERSTSAANQDNSPIYKSEHMRDGHAKNNDMGR